MLIANYQCNYMSIYMCICMYMFLSLSLSLRPIVVEGDPKAPILIATTPRCRGGHNSFPWIAPLYP